MNLLIQWESMEFFSWIGIFAVRIIIIPNFAFAKKGRQTRLDDVDTAGYFASFLEVVSRICLTLALILIDMPLGHMGFAIAALAALAVYFILWIRYFKEGCYYPDIYMKNFLGIPVPFDVFISIYFITVSLWLSNMVALGFSLVYGVCRLMNAAAARKDLKSRKTEE